MCGRTTLIASAAVVARWLGLEVGEWAPRYNLCPGEDLLVVRLSAAGEAEAMPMRWGLVPYWAKDPRIAYQCINARAETVTTKPAFRDAFQRRRCLIVIDGWYEWETLPGGRKQPYAIRMPDGAPFAFAGLWETWRPPQGERLTTCTIVTTGANAATLHLHHRMPVVLSPEEFPAWLDPATPVAALQAMLRPYDGALAVFRVSPMVNNGRVDEAKCLEPQEATRIT
jgi:putative SOS response-associated peptidase YedK